MNCKKGRNNWKLLQNKNRYIVLTQYQLISLISVNNNSQSVSLVYQFSGFIWEPFGNHLEGIWTIVDYLGSFGTVWDSFGIHLGPFGSHLGPFGSHSGPVWRHLGVI